jgi:ElaB/YqjD/DUF883 family membrane-anchored ribosome-binding protein
LGSVLIPGAESIWRATVLDYPTAPRSLEAVETLISSVEELLCRLPATDSQMGRLRAQATNALAAAKSALAANMTEDSAQPLSAERAYFDACVREWPRTALALAATLGLALGLVAARRSQARRSAY